MPRSAAIACAFASSVLSSAFAAKAQSHASEAPVDDALDGIAVPHEAHSIWILHDGEEIHVQPDVASPRRGAAALNARLPALEARRGPGCQIAWVRVSRDGWACLDEARYAGDPPAQGDALTVPQGEVVPFAYAFATSGGVRTYRSLEDVVNDDWAEQLERGMGVAIDRSQRYEGRTWAHTVSARWIAQTDLAPAHPSTRDGVAYDSGEAVDAVGFVARRAFTYASADDAANRRGAHPSGFLEARAAVHLREWQTVRGQRVARTDAGWIAGSAVRTVEPAEPPSPLAANERWVDVNERAQVLVAYEGTRPVMATLVSTGGRGHATTHGTFRVWVKLAASDMSNTDDANVDTATAVYSVERVPWVMYFHNDQALHGVYWHDRFGTPRSHGCVNLAPRDARWLFAWAPPRMPPGWNAVLPTADEPGLLVRVR